ncbi:MAG: helix-turn-helix transcriptional regulator [Actinomycetales bacterium]|nr:helix-turn-helix transcriptional regulator [Actinomycetales bacterium]
MRELRVARGWSLRDLGERICFNRAYVGKVEQGDKFPDRKFAELAEIALQAGGSLTSAWDTEDAERRRVERTGRLLATSVSESMRLIGDNEELDLDELHRATQQLAVAYLANPPIPMLAEAVELRRLILQRLKTHHYRPRDLSDLYLDLARVQGALSYASLDLGDSRGAATHAEVAWLYADLADDNELRVWIRGTQSLIARFDSDYPRALGLVQDGFRYPTAGTGHLRLLAGLAQCRANLGDSPGATEALDQAQRERDTLATADSAPGLFTFSQAKQHYYAGSSMLWLEGGEHASRAAREASIAISLWEREPPETRSLDDEALAHVYQAIAHVRLGDLDSATVAVRPVLDLPPERRISWIHKRLRDLAERLTTASLRSAPEAVSLREEICDVFC